MHVKILGLSAYYHDSAAALIDEGKIVAAVQEERFSRKKHDASFPYQAVVYCLKQGKCSLDDLDAVVFYDKPFLKFERLLETYYRNVPKGFISFARSMPVWIKEKIMLKNLLRKELKKVMPYNKKKMRLLFPEHHLSHAASAFYPSSFKEAAIITIDGVGEWATSCIMLGKNNGIKVLKELQFPHSVGLLYSAFTYFLGFKVNSGEYKLMGLAPYGNAGSERVEQFAKKIKEELVEIKEDGSVLLNQDYFSYSTGLRMISSKRWERLFEMERRKPEGELNMSHCDLAYAIQKVTEDIVCKMAVEAKRLTSCDNLCMAGGVALNCVANGKLSKENIFKNIFIQPAAGDAGGSLGAALAAYYIYFKKDRCIVDNSMQGAYLGPEYKEDEVKEVLEGFGAKYRQLDQKEIMQTVAKVISEGGVVGWFQGRMEFGPRALGNRSILADPRNPEIQRKLNLKIKYRESFRPFAPSALAEYKDQYFDLRGDSPFMLFVAEVKKSIRKNLPADFRQMDVKQKLYCLRSEIPAVTHVDFSARLQTVHGDTNPVFWQLIDTFRQLTGCALMVNTSFNVRGEPIVCTPEDAYNCFMQTEMDFLVIGSLFLRKEEQPEWKEKDYRKVDHTLD